MKKIVNKINFGIIALMVAMGPVLAAGEKIQVDMNKSGGEDLCNLLYRLHDVFNILRIMAFLGAAFYIAGWAWGFISSGKMETKDVKEKGTALLVGFILLFVIGLLLSFVMSASGMELIGGCKDVFKKW